MLTSTLRAEDALLVWIASAVVRDGAPAQFRELIKSRDLDWEYLRATANRNGLVNLLSFQLQSLTAQTIPAEVISELRSDYQLTTRYSLSLASALTRVLDCFAKAGIECTPFKGPTLALLAYGDVGLRQFSDLDLLVHKPDMPQVKHVLAECGYGPTFDLSRSREAALLRYGHAYSFGNESGVFLDVHWDILEPHFCVALDSDSMWERRKPVKLGGKEVLTFEPEDLLLILCIHGFSHWWERLGWVCDVAGLISRNERLDWEAVFERARESGTLRILLLGLLLASELLHAELPPEVSKAVHADDRVRIAVAKVEAQLFSDAKPILGILESVRAQIRMRERRRDQIKLIFRSVTTPSRYDWMSTSVPDSLYFLYYLLRPIRLARKYGSKLLKTVPESSVSKDGRG